uniref:Polycystin 2 like 2, transient receptor potential cation channel n=1 Tax=Molossus molossus TaxID=27622 RepID=A0A7J8IA99_MOLMO|nr:polycystin 2 like 2, transient receptor potential cation channel [Molossus molossus]
MPVASRWHRGGTPTHKLHFRKEVEIRTTLQELLLYCIFLINLCILTFGMVNQHMYYLNKVMSSLFLDTSMPGDERTNFKSIRSITDFWKIGGRIPCNWRNTYFMAVLLCEAPQIC